MRYYRSFSIVTPAAAADMRLASRETFKQGVGIKDGENDEYIEFLLDANSAAFQKECDRVLYRETVQDVFTGTQPHSRDDRQQIRSIVLSRFPVVSIVSVADASGTIDPAHYSLDGPSGILRFHERRCWPAWSGQALTVQYVAGYLTPSQAGRNLPYDVEKAVLTMARMDYKARQRDPSMRSQEAVAGNQSFWIGIPPDVQGVIDSYCDARMSL